MDNKLINIKFNIPIEFETVYKNEMEYLAFIVVGEIYKFLNKNNIDTVITEEDMIEIVQSKFDAKLSK